MLYVVVMTSDPMVNAASVQSYMTTAHSWYRFAPTSWVICTHEGAQSWSDRLGVFVKPKGNLFVSRLDPSDRQGWMANEFWDWVRLHASH